MNEDPLTSLQKLLGSKHKAVLPATLTIDNVSFPASSLVFRSPTTFVIDVYHPDKVGVQAKVPETGTATVKDRFDTLKGLKKSRR